MQCICTAPVGAKGNIFMPGEVFDVMMSEVGSSTNTEEIHLGHQNEELEETKFSVSIEFFNNFFKII